MRILFIDVTRDFGLSTPLNSPLGGLQSAICYLARELSLQGHQVTIANQTATVRVEEGVRFVPWNKMGDGIASMDAIVVTAATGAMVAEWQALHGRQPLWILWVHYDIDQPAISLLAKAADRDAFDGFLFVSEWQTQAFRETFGVGWDRAFVLRNAVSPAFHGLFGIDEPILPQKSPDPLLVYTSTPFRGLAPLLDAVPLIRAQVPDARFQIFSSWAVYGRTNEADPHHDLYERCKNTPGVEYIGSVPQRQLAQHLKSAWCLAYPSIFSETSCIAVMEGIAAGCKVVTTHRAALPETTVGFAQLIVNPADEADLSRRFADVAARVLQEFRTSPAVVERELQGAVAYARTHFTWGLRATQLVEWLSARKPAATVIATALAPSVTRLSGQLELIHGRHGMFLVDGTDGLIGSTLAGCGEWRDDSVAVLRSVLRPGDGVIDVGAHMGAMTIPLAQAVGETGQVHAFEPQEASFRLLEANLALNQLPHVRSERALVGNGDGRWAATGVDVDPAWGRFTRQDSSAPGIPSIKLDDALPALASCRLVTISAPGMLGDVVEGMMGIIAKHAPLIYCEINSDAEFVRLRDLLAPRGYFLHWHCSETFNPENFFGRATGTPRTCLNVLCLPQGGRIFSPLHPALFPGDPDILFPDRSFVFRAKDAEPLSAPPAIPGDILAADPAALAGKWERDTLLNAHLGYVTAQSHGEATLPGHALWFELLGSLAPTPDLTMACLGEGAQIAASLCGLIAKARGVNLSVHAALADGILPKPEMEKIALLFWIFALDRNSLRFIDGAALRDAGIQYHIVFARGPGSAAAAARLVAPGGFLVHEGDDAVGVPLEAVMATGPYRLYRNAT